MPTEPGIFRKMLETVRNHQARAQEGRELLQRGRPLSEMKTPPTGLNFEETNNRREDYINSLRAMDVKKLQWVYGNVMYQLHRRLQDPDKGTSELEWDRIAFVDEFERRGLKPPEVDSEKVRRQENRP